MIFIKEISLIVLHNQNISFQSSLLLISIMMYCQWIKSEILEVLKYYLAKPFSYTVKKILFLIIKYLIDESIQLKNKKNKEYSDLVESNN